MIEVVGKEKEEKSHEDLKRREDITFLKTKNKTISSIAGWIFFFFFRK